MPAQPAVIETSSNRTAGQQVAPHTIIHFQPDGTYIVEVIGNVDYTEYGWVVVVQDERGGRPDYHLIELYPTGLIRRITNIDNSDE